MVRVIGCNEGKRMAHNNEHGARNHAKPRNRAERQEAPKLEALTLRAIICHARTLNTQTAQAFAAAAQRESVYGWE